MVVVGVWLFVEEEVVCGEFGELLTWEVECFCTWVVDRWGVGMLQVKGFVRCL